MIWESHYWKHPLLEMAERLRTLKTESKLTDDELAQTEKDIFIGFYSVRKLIDAQTKITDAARTSKIRLTWHPSIKPSDILWAPNPGKLYDFEKGGAGGARYRFCVRPYYSQLPFYAHCDGVGGAGRHSVYVGYGQGQAGLLLRN